MSTHLLVCSQPCKLHSSKICLTFQNPVTKGTKTEAFWWKTLYSKFINLNVQFAFLSTNCALQKISPLDHCSDCRKLFKISKRINQQRERRIFSRGYKRGIIQSIKFICRGGSRGVRPKRVSLRIWAFLLAKWWSPLHEEQKLTLRWIDRITAGKKRSSWKMLTFFVIVSLGDCICVVHQKVSEFFNRIR